MQQVQQAPPSRPLQLRFSVLKTHLILKIFNNLDETSRKHAFCVMGWPRDHYLKRKEGLRKQLVQRRRQELLAEAKAQREAKTKEEEQAKEEEPAEEGTASDAAEQGERSGEEAEVAGAGASARCGDGDPLSKEEKNEAPVDEMQDLVIREEDMVFAEADLLPLLSARIDPDTLLERLNTRRLYLRVLNFKRRERRRLEEAAAQMLGDEATACRGSIQDMFAEDVKQKMTAQRVYRKNVDIQDMAELEWDELLEAAELR